MTIEYDSKWSDIDLFPNAPLLFSRELKARPSTLLCIGFLSGLLSDAKMRIYFVLPLD